MANPPYFSSMLTNAQLVTADTKNQADAWKLTVTSPSDTRVRSLVYKRHIERPQRVWRIWAFDVGKQLVGGLLIHFSNIMVSSVLLSAGDECAMLDR